MNTNGSNGSNGSSGHNGHNGTGGGGGGIHPTSMVLIGDLLVIGSQVLSAVQMVVEEKVRTKRLKTKDRLQSIPVDTCHTEDA